MAVVSVLGIVFLVYSLCCSSSPPPKVVRASDATAAKKNEQPETAAAAEAVDEDEDTAAAEPAAEKTKENKELRSVDAYSQIGSTHACSTHARSTCTAPTEAQHTHAHSPCTYAHAGAYTRRAFAELHTHTIAFDVLRCSQRKAGQPKPSSS